MPTPEQQMAPPSGPEVPVAEAVVWSNIRKEMAARGNLEEADSIQEVLKAIPTESMPVGLYKKVSFGVYQRLSDYSGGYNASNGEQVSWYFSALRPDSDNSLPEEEALEIATAIAKPPADAVLQESRYDEQAGTIYYMARWQHRVRRIPVERDFIQVLVNGGTKKPFALHRFWHEVNEQPTVR